jgi:phosphate transport system substrate-binding protein
MGSNSFLRIFVSIILIMGIIGAGFVCMIIAAFGGSRFYSNLSMIVTGTLIIFVIVGAIAAPKLKKVMIAFLSFVLICTAVITIYEIYKWYDDRIPVLNDQGVDLNLYKPFSDNTKAVTLSEASTLKINDNLPVLDGATALYPLYSAFAQAVYPNNKEYEIDRSEVMCNNTIGAYENLINGSVDVIFAARPSKEQVQSAKDKGLEFKLTPIGKEAFVFFANSANPVDGLTSKQIQDIYSGVITNWKEVGGNDEAIRAFQRKENSGSQTMLIKFMEGKNLMTPPKKDRIAGMGEIIKQTADYKNYKNAIGFSFLFFATEMVKDKQIKLLKVDGIYPDRDTIKNKQYPLVTEFYAVTAGSKNRNVDSLIQWILSPQGQKIIEKTGYTPIK